MPVILLLGRLEQEGGDEVEGVEGEGDDDVEGDEEDGAVVEAGGALAVAGEPVAARLGGGEDG